MKFYALNTLIPVPLQNLQKSNLGNLATNKGMADIKPCDVTGNSFFFMNKKIINYFYLDSIQLT